MLPSAISVPVYTQAPQLPELDTLHDVCTQLPVECLYLHRLVSMKLGQQLHCPGVQYLQPHLLLLQCLAQGSQRKLCKDIQLADYQVWATLCSHQCHITIWKPLLTAPQISGVSKAVDADGYYTYTRPEGKQGGHGVGWSELPRYAFKVPPGWSEKAVSIADLGGTEVLKYCNQYCCHLQLLFFP